MDVLVCCQPPPLPQTRIQGLDKAWKALSGMHNRSLLATFRRRKKHSMDSPGKFIREPAPSCPQLPGIAYCVHLKLWSIHRCLVRLELHVFSRRSQSVEVQNMVSLKMALKELLCHKARHKRVVNCTCEQGCLPKPDSVHSLDHVLLSELKLYRTPVCVPLVGMNYLIPGPSFGEKYCLIIESFVQRNVTANNEKKNCSLYSSTFYTSLLRRQSNLLQSGIYTYLSTEVLKWKKVLRKEYSAF